MTHAAFSTKNTIVEQNMYVSPNRLVYSIQIDGREYNNVRHCDAEFIYRVLDGGAARKKYPDYSIHSLGQKSTVSRECRENEEKKP